MSNRFSNASIKNARSEVEIQNEAASRIQKVMFDDGTRSIEPDNKRAIKTSFFLNLFNKYNKEKL